MAGGKIEFELGGAKREAIVGLPLTSHPPRGTKIVEVGGVRYALFIGFDDGTYHVREVPK